LGSSSRLRLLVDARDGQPAQADNKSEHQKTYEDHPGTDITKVHIGGVCGASRFFSHVNTLFLQQQQRRNRRKLTRIAGFSPPRHNRITQTPCIVLIKTGNALIRLQHPTEVEIADTSHSPKRAAFKAAHECLSARVL
jgi:hypothetical protein